MRNPFSWTIILRESFYKFQLKVALAALSMNAKYFHLRKWLILPSSLISCLSDLLFSIHFKKVPKCFAEYCSCICLWKNILLLILLPKFSVWYFNLFFYWIRFQYIFGAYFSLFFYSKQILQFFLFFFLH